MTTARPTAKYRRVSSGLRLDRAAMERVYYRSQWTEACFRPFTLWVSSTSGMVSRNSHPSA